MVRNIKYYKLKLGRTYNYKVGNMVRAVRLVRVTPKGFNLQEIITGKMVHRKPLYAKGMGGTEIPNDMSVFELGFPVFYNNDIPVISTKQVFDDENF